MKIQCTPEEYKLLIRCLDLSNSIFGLLGDYSDDKYKRLDKSVENIKSKLLRQAKDYNFEHNLEDISGHGTDLREKFVDETMDIIFEFEETMFWEDLNNKYGKYLLEKNNLLYDEDEDISMVRIFEVEDRLGNLFEDIGLDVLHLNSSTEKEILAGLNTDAFRVEVKNRI
jgi:hypothetical protein